MPRMAQSGPVSRYIFVVLFERGEAGDLVDVRRNRCRCRAARDLDRQPLVREKSHRLTPLTTGQIKLLHQIK